ncbi:MAG: heavy metal-responsive transcriptional regulator [Proteobacteria bacterium]|nr:MAG: heavy metal-responsive transcriptional regulator [Pseudomonadota bacterium]
MSWQSEPPDPRAPRAGGAAQLAISDVCAETGLSARTVRYYEELGLLPGVRRRAGGRRVYGPDEVERLRFIQRLQLLGLPLAEIRELNDVHALAGSTADLLERLDQLLGQRLADLDGRIAELTALRDQIEKYRARVASRAGALRTQEETGS